jgi:hypothetical protein
MSNNILTGVERQAFCQPITKDWALGYFYAHDNVPLHFLYKDSLIKGEYSDLEKRNKEITECIWLDAYNYYSICNIYYEFLFRPSYPQQIKSLQMPLQAFMYSKPRPISEENGGARSYMTTEQVKANLDAWMATTGGKLLEERRKEPPSNYSEWDILLGAPDRTMHLVSVTPFGNQVIMEAIVTWSEGGIIKETAYAGVIMYDEDGTVLVDRDYMDIINWPSVTENKLEERRQRELAAANNGQIKGALDIYLNRYKNKRIEGILTDIEKQNRITTEGKWVDAHNNLEYSLFHNERYRVQLPLQKISYNREISKTVDTNILKAFPDRKIRPVVTYAKGNQVIAECIMAWTERGIYKESPFISLLLFDKDGLVIRERRYINLAHWPGSIEITKITGLV